METLNEEELSEVNERIDLLEDIDWDTCERCLIARTAHGGLYAENVYYN